MKKPKINRIKKIKWNTIKKVKNKSVEKLKEKLLFVKRIKQNIIKHKKSAKKRNKSLLIKSKRSKKAEKPIQKSFQENLKKKFLFKALQFKLKFQKFTKKNLIKTSTKYAVFKTKRFRQVFRRRKMLQKTRFRYRNVKKHKISTRINSFINFDKYEIMKLHFFMGLGKKKRERNIEVFYGHFNSIAKHSFININLLIMNLRLGLSFILKSLIFNAKLMLVSWAVDHQVKAPKIFRHHFFFKGPWFPGFLSNFRNLRFHKSFFFKQKFFPKRSNRARKPSTTLMLADVGLTMLPTINFILDSRDNNYSVLEESLTLTLPTIALMHPYHLADHRMITYPIIASSYSFLQGCYIIYLIIQLLLSQSIIRKAKLKGF